MRPGLSPIILDRNWQVSTAGGTGWLSLPALAAYPRNRVPLRLRCVVDLQPTGVCVRYVLRLEAAPPGTIITVNGWRVGTAGGDIFQANVTDQVALDANMIELDISAAGDLRGVSLQAIPCANMD